MPPRWLAQRRVRTWLALGLVALAAAWVGHYAFWRHHAKRLTVVRPGVLYRVAQPTELGLRKLVQDYHVRTIVSLQLYDWPLARGIYDPGPPDGCKESDYVRQLGATSLQWPMGEEACWPWTTPWQFEAFFELMDDPRNHPVAIHCMGGRHRTGTLAALFRLEYDRWPAERALDEMRSFRFGGPIVVQEHNLRTYWPRPWPQPAVWAQLAAAWQPALSPPPGDFAALVRALQASRIAEPAVQAALAQYVAQDRPFALPLAQRLVNALDDPLRPSACSLALRRLADANATDDELYAAAALLADFGEREQQASLLERVQSPGSTAQAQVQFEALVGGLTNRYTRNRLPYLAALLDDERPRLKSGAESYRYCDTAVAHWSATVNENPLAVVSLPTRDDWERGRAALRAWQDAHAEQFALRTLVPPDGENVVHAGLPPEPEEDVRRMR